MNLLDSLKGFRDVFSKAEPPAATANQGRSSPDTPAALGAVDKNGFLVPLRSPKELVGLALNEWMVGTSIDKIVSEETREGYEFTLKDPEMEDRREELEKELEGIKALLEAPNRDDEGVVKYSTKDLLAGMAWYQVVTADYFLEKIGDVAGRPVALWPLPSEYMRERAPGAEPQYFCKQCYKPDVYYPTFKPCPKCGAETVPTKWVQVDDEEKIVGRWTHGEILSNLSRAYGRRKRGISKVQRVWYVCQVIKWMERYQYSSYANNTSANKIVAMPKMSQKVVNDMLQGVVDAKKKNPEIRKNLMIGVEEAPIILDMMGSLVDLDARNLAEFYREAVAINMGVSLNVLGVQTPGKLGQEIETIEVSMDTIVEGQGEIDEFWNTKVLPLFPEIQSWEFHLRSPKKDDLLRKSQIENTKVQTLSTLQMLGIDAIIDENWELIIRNPEPDMTRRYQPPTFNRWGEEEDEKDEEVEKSLKPRNAPKGQGVPTGISTAERDFLNKLEAVREKSLSKVRGGNYDEVIKALEEALNVLVDEIVKEARQFQIDYYAEVLDREARKEGWDPAFMQEDLNALEFMRADPMGAESALKRFVGSQREQLFDVIESQYRTAGGFTIPQLTEELSKVISGTRYELERIVRTETSRITNLARRNRWAKIASPQDVYDFVPAHDPRTCETCYAVAFGGSVEIDKMMKSFHGNPYTFDEMMEADGGKGYMHPNCRCSWVRRPYSAGGRT